MWRLKAGVVLWSRGGAAAPSEEICIRLARHPVFAHARGRLSVRAISILRPDFLLPRGRRAGTAGNNCPCLFDPPADRRTGTGLGQGFGRTSALFARRKKSR